MAAAISDIHTGKIRNWLIFLGLILGGIITIFEKGIVAIPFWIIQIFIPVFLFFLMFRIGGLGAGDIKLFSVIASFLTIEEWWICMTAAFLSGAVICIFKIMFAKKMKDPHRIHFSIPILAGYLYFFLGVIS
ncbi:MAG: hypothetical protein HFI37_01420 [Lachnospiraceae bacterium]|nr:hypothetical protein [Lachnospiraceae bacterium]